MAIQSFADGDVELFFKTGRVGKRVSWRDVKKIVLRKLDMLHCAALLLDLRSPPGNGLETLKGNLAGFYSVRVNDQWRIIFRWGEKGPEEIRVADYH